MRNRRHGFTLIEIVTVCGIVVVVAAILLPALNRARKQAARVQVKSNLITIGTAVEHYKNDHKGYFPVPGPVSVSTSGGYDGGAALWMMVLSPPTPAKGGQTPAPRVTSTSKITYLNPGDFQTRRIGERATVILDRFDNPIVYFPASPARPNVRMPAPDGPSHVGLHDVNCFFDARDNTGPGGQGTAQTNEVGASFYRVGRKQDSLTPLLRVRLMLGDRHGTSPGTPPDGLIQADESGVEKPFLLWSAGPDGMFGPDDADDVPRCDDVTNFQD